jgi:uncharacterized protein (DUF433 family)
MDFVTHYQRIEETSLDDLISYAHGPELAAAALIVAEHFSAMTARQIINACQYDSRLSDAICQAASKLDGQIEERADLMVAEDRAQARESAA